MHVSPVLTPGYTAQQPWVVKAPVQFCGQRFGEMEVWALEHMVLPHTCKEIMTVESRRDVLVVLRHEAIIWEGENIPELGVQNLQGTSLRKCSPERFLVWMFRFREGWCLEVEMTESIDCDTELSVPCWKAICFTMTESLTQLRIIEQESRTMSFGE